jgi:hypothetical protein
MSLTYRFKPVTLIRRPMASHCVRAKSISTSLRLAIALAGKVIVLHYVTIDINAVRNEVENDLAGPQGLRDRSQLRQA